MAHADLIDDEPTDAELEACISHCFTSREPITDDDAKLEQWAAPLDLLELLAVE